MSNSTVGAFIWAVALGIVIFMIVKSANPPNRLCPKCGYQSSYAQYCYKDGTRMVPHPKIRRLCPKCHQEVSKLDAYCDRCGAELKQTK